MISQKNNIRKALIITAIITIIAALPSCRSAKNVTGTNLKPMAADKVMKRVCKNSPNFDCYTADHISFSFTNAGEKNSASAQLKIKNDKKMIISLKKMGFPIGRGLIEKDSVTVVNFIERSYFKAGFDFIDSEINYDMIQALIMGDICKIISLKGIDLDYSLDIDNETQTYKLTSEFNHKITKAVDKGKKSRLNKYMSEMDDNEFFSVTILVDPELFVAKKMELKNIKTGQNISIEYPSYKKTGRDIFPSSIKFDISSGDENGLSATLKIGKISTKKDKNYDFSIPKNYEYIKP